MNMTEQEITLLCAVYPCEDLIREGKLFPQQERALELLRAGSAYLAARYPDEEIRLLSFTPPNPFAAMAKLRFRCGEEEPVYFALISPEEGCPCADSLCNARLRPAYDALVEQRLRDAGFETRSLTVFPNPIEGSFPADGSPEELLRRFPSFARSTRLFLPAAYDRESLPEELHGALRQAGLYGSYAVALVESLDGQEAEALNARWGDLERRSFNCFDIG
jgi:hypothetical protein